MRLVDAGWTDANFVAGELCLDFSNTLSGRWQGCLRERLDDIAALLDWFEAAGLLSDAEKARARLEIDGRSRKAAKMLADAKRLREFIFDIFDAIRSNETPDETSLEPLNRFVKETAVLRVIGGSSEGYGWCWKTETDAFGAALGQIAFSAADLLTSERRSLVKKCRAESCAWLFVDDSKNRSRIWCDMAVCGNRAKARRYSHARK